MASENPSTARDNVINLIPYLEAQNPKLGTEDVHADVVCLIPALKVSSIEEALYPHQETTAEHIAALMQPSVMAQVFAERIREAV